jgi:hypothetical protein
LWPRSGKFANKAVFCRNIFAEIALFAVFIG